MLKVVECVGCGKSPSQIGEFVRGAKEFNMTPEKFVINEEGTYNNMNGHFYCTDCYIKAGMPLGVAK